MHVVREALGTAAASVCVRIFWCGPLPSGWGSGTLQQVQVCSLQSASVTARAGSHVILMGRMEDRF